MNVLFGGTAIRTTANSGGFLSVSGTAFSTTVGTGGEQQVEEMATSFGAVISGGRQEVVNQGGATATTVPPAVSSWSPMVAGRTEPW